MSNRSVFANNIGFALDGQNFTNFDVTGNQFTFAGGPLPIFNDTTFTGNQIQFIGPAANTLAFIHMLLALSPPQDRTPTLQSLGFIGPDEEVVVRVRNDG